MDAVIFMIEEEMNTPNISKIIIDRVEAIKTKNTIKVFAKYIFLLLPFFILKNKEETNTNLYFPNTRVSRLRVWCAFVIKQTIDALLL